MSNYKLSNEENKIEILPDKKIAASWIPYIYIIASLADIIFFIVSLFTKPVLTAIAAGICIILLIAHTILDNALAWFKKEDLEFTNDGLIFKKREIVGVSGKDITTYKITACKKISYKKGKCIIKGDITKKTYMRKESSEKSVEIYNVSDEQYNAIKMYFQK